MRTWREVQEFGCLLLMFVFFFCLTIAALALTIEGLMWLGVGD